MWILTEDENAVNTAHVVSLCTWYEGENDYQVRADLAVTATALYAPDALGEGGSYAGQDPVQMTLAAGLTKAEASALLNKLVLADPHAPAIKITDLLPSRPA